MKRDDTCKTRKNGQAGFGMKQLMALILGLVMAMVMLCAAAEDSDGILLPDDSAQETSEELFIRDEPIDESGTVLELGGDAILNEDGLVIDELSLDGLEENLIADELGGLEIVSGDPVNAMAGNESKPEDFEIDEDGVLVKYVGEGGDVVIPDSVTSIGEAAFWNCDSLTSVTIPDSVTSIGDHAFAYCSSLTSVTIPNSVTSIGEKAFYECSSLTSVTIPDSVTSIGEETFNHCSSLTSVTIPDSVTSIGEYAFSDCSSLTSVKVGAGVGIADLLASSLFYHEAIEAITVTENNGVYASDDGILYTYDMSTLLRCPRAKTSVTIPDSVTSISESAFYACSSLTSVTIPDSVTSIGEYAFSDCSSLKSVKIGSGVSIADLFHSRLLRNEAIEAITVTKNNGVYASKNGVLYTYDMSTLLRCFEAKTSVTIPDSVTSIGEYAFYDCSSLTSVTIPDSVTSIGEYAFYDCSSLTSVTIGNSVTSIGDGAFEGCSSLTSVTIPDSVTSIGEYAFFDCSSLTSVTIPDSVTSIGEKAFYECSSLTSVTIPDSVTSIGEETFSLCSSLTSVTIPGSVKEIGEWAFAWCSSLSSVTILDGVTSIGDLAFCDCINLKDVYIPASVKNIARFAFCYISYDTWDEYEEEFQDEAKKKLRMTIHCLVGSYAEKYARKEGFEFSPIISLAKAKVTVSSVVYTGKAQKPSVKVVLDERTLKKDTDYIVTYKNNVKPGKGTVTVKGKGNYTGTAKATFAIRVPLSMCKLTVKDQAYTGKAIKPAVTVKYGKKTLKKGTDYTVTYRNNKAIGKATVTVAGKGGYTGSAKATFRINPKAVTGLKLTAGKGKLTASWKKPAGGVGGYQLQYALKKNFNGGRKVTVKKASTLKATLKGLKAGKTYYVRIRAWKKVGGKTYWSAWSAAKKAKVK